MRWALAAAILAGGFAGCGLAVRSPDLFLLTRVGQGRPLTVLINDDGTVRCNGGHQRQLPDPLLLQARDLANKLDTDAKHKLRIPRTPRAVFYYTIKLQDGTIAFPDTAGATHDELARAELLAVQAAAQGCGINA